MFSRGLFVCAPLSDEMLGIPGWKGVSLVVKPAGKSLADRYTWSCKLREPVVRQGKVLGDWGPSPTRTSPALQFGAPSSSGPPWLAFASPQHCFWCQPSAVTSMVSPPPPHPSMPLLPAWVPFTISTLISLLVTFLYPTQAPAFPRRPL